MRAKLLTKAAETPLRIFQVDSFTATRFTGNPAVVVLDADGQSDATLLAVAREFSHAEVAFVLAANGPDHDVRLRFFNARKEAPFVGHSTVAAHAVLLALGRRGAGAHRHHRGHGPRRTRRARPGNPHRVSPDGSGTGCSAAFQNHAARRRGTASAG